MSRPKQLRSLTTTTASTPSLKPAHIRQSHLISCHQVRVALLARLLIHRVQSSQRKTTAQQWRITRDARRYVCTETFALGHSLPLLYCSSHHESVACCPFDMSEHSVFDPLSVRPSCHNVGCVDRIRCGRSQHDHQGGERAIQWTLSQVLSFCCLVPEYY